MHNALTAVALLSLAAVNAAPVAKPQTSTDWSSLWQSQLSSMASVQSAMASPGYGIAPAAPSEAGPIVAAYSTESLTPWSPSMPAYGVKPTTQNIAPAAPTQPAAPLTQAPPAPIPTSYPTVAPSVPAPSVPSAPSAPSAPLAPAPAGPPPSGGSGPSVTNSAAFGNGAACNNPSAVPASQPPVDSYTCFGSNYPSQDTWATFDDLWQINGKLLSEACSNLGSGADNTQSQTDDIHAAIMDVASSSFVDPRFIMAVMMQESHGCVNVGTTSNGVSNPGLMQSHNGVKFTASDPKNSITQMIRDGVQGTASGDGLVQLINQYGDPWKAARAYNSGSIAADGNLNNGNGATASYVMDVANRLRGWSLNPGIAPTCPGVA